MESEIEVEPGVRGSRRGSSLACTVIAGARNYLYANRPLEFRFEVTA